jgi:hypothetical protein
MDQAASPAAQGEFTRLDRSECLRLLAGAPVGRLIFTVNALPVVRPVNFALVDGLIVLRAAADTTVARKVDDMIVAFEADQLYPATSSGWSVTVTGRATLITDPAMIARYQAVPLVPWAPGVRDQFVTITTELIDGLRVRRPPGGYRVLPTVPGDERQAPYPGRGASGALRPAPGYGDGWTLPLS